MVQTPFDDRCFMYHADGSQNDNLENNNEVDNVKKKYNVLEKRLTDVEGSDIFGFDVMNMCLVADLTVLAKFKVAKFEKYQGHTCPKDHLTMYFHKMASHSKNDKLLIHYFQDSLTRASL